MKFRHCVFVFLGMLLCAASCQTPLVQEQSYPAFGDQEIRKVAVLPLRLSTQLSVPQSGAQTTPEVASEIVAHALAEALASRGVEVIAPIDVQRTLEYLGEDPNSVNVPTLAKIVREELGADAFLLGKLLRWVEREGSARGATTYAAVGFEVQLRSATNAQKLWDAVFDERQKPMGENVLVTSQYPGGGTRWLTAEELARWGARQLVQAIPLADR